MLLRIVRRPALAIEEGIGYARIRLIHADNDAAGGEAFLLWLVAAFFSRHIRGGRVGELLNFNMLALENLQQLNFAIRCCGVGRDDISRRAFESRLLNGALALGGVV